MLDKHYDSPNNDAGQGKANEGSEHPDCDNRLLCAFELLIEVVKSVVSLNLTTQIVEVLTPVVVHNYSFVYPGLSIGVGAFARVPHSIHSISVK